ncbi:hypothetical protein HYALB_00012444 [Hymenoscyphus albidus]|uniref:Uncharacterized protein n=1 Tax=Hymenoscyphus albidus TaxID=595503 RepID=A0A9N9Q9V8_9HELO|nr:hypothetical protein HYALB_00012444 [Hymenoscyphus albidus]
MVVSTETSPTEEVNGSYTTIHVPGEGNVKRFTSNSPRRKFVDARQYINDRITALMQLIEEFGEHYDEWCEDPNNPKAGRKHFFKVTARVSGDVAKRVTGGTQEKKDMRFYLGELEEKHQTKNHPTAVNVAIRPTTVIVVDYPTFVNVV